MKSLTAITTLNLISATCAYSQLSVGNSTTDLYHYNAVNASFQHTVTSTTNSLLVVTVVGDVTNPWVTDVSFGGTSLTRAVGFGNSGGNAEFAQVWYLFAPTVGEATVTVTQAATVGKGYDVAAMDFGNIVQNTVLDTDGFTTTGNGTSQTLNFDLSSANNGALLIGGLVNQLSSSSTPPSGTNLVIDDNIITVEGLGTTTTTSGYQSIAAVDTSSSYDWDWSWTRNTDYAIAGAAFAVVPEPSAYTLMLGLGALAWIGARRHNRCN